MPEEKTFEAFFKISALNLKEEITDLYIYQDFNTSKFTFMYNDEIKFPINLEKTFWKKRGKVKNYFNLIEDIKAEWHYKEDLVRLTYTLK